MTGDLWLVVVAVVCVMATMLLVTVEEAFSAVSRAHVAELADEGRRGARGLLRMLGDRALYVNVLLFARITTATFAVVSVTVLCLRLIPDPAWLGPTVAGLVMLLVGYVGFGVASRTIGQQRSGEVAVAWRWLARVCLVLFGWLATGMILLGNALTPGRGYRHGPFATQSELREIVDLAAADHVIEADERQMIHSVFELGGTTARTVMVPRTEIVWIDRHKRIRQALSLSLRSGYSRIPVTGADLDDIVGVIYLKDLVRRVFESRGALESTEVAEVMRPVMFVPDSKPVDDLMREMQAARVHLAVAVDEYGGTAGLVTIEDIIEEIVGEIADEYDAAETPDVAKLGTGEWRVSARLPLDDLEDATGIDVAPYVDSVDTVAGLLALRLGVVPIPGSRVEIDGFRFVAEAGEGRRNQVGTVLVQIVEPEASGPEKDGAAGG